VSERLREAFERRNAAGEAALVIYVTQGDPSPAASVEIVVRAAEAGADVIELGVPFSDPSADGEVIQLAAQRAIAAGGGLASALETVAAVRARGCQVPIVLFGYYNPIFVMGVDRFADAAAAAGVDATLVVDLPLEEVAELHEPLRRRSIGVVPLVAPTSGADRIARVAELDAPFVYYVSMTGITGAERRSDADVADRVAEVKRATGCPVAVGFGIATPDDAAAVAAFADGVVIGSAVVREVAAAPQRAADAVGAFVGAVRSALTARA